MKKEKELDIGIDIDGDSKPDFMIKLKGYGWWITSLGISFAIGYFVGKVV